MAAQPSSALIDLLMGGRQRRAQPGSSFGLFSEAIASGRSTPNILGHLASGRAIVGNPDGSVSTHFSATRPLPDGGGWVSFPTMFGGRRLSEDQAFAIVRANGFMDPETGEPVRVFRSEEEATAAAIAVSRAADAEARKLLGGTR